MNVIQEIHRKRKKYMRPDSSLFTLADFNDKVFVIVFCSVFILQKILTILFTICQLLTLGSSLKILYLVPFPAPSHWFWLKNFAEELLKRGHDVRMRQTIQPRMNF